MNSSDQIAKDIVDAAYKLHTELGPGLLESVFSIALAHEIDSRGLGVCREQHIPIRSIW